MMEDLEPSGAFNRRSAARDGSVWVVRSAVAGDLERLVSLEEAAKPVPWGRAGIAGFIGRDPGVIVVCPSADEKPDGGEPAGFAISQWLADEMEILSIAVDPSRRRRGLGRMLMTAMAAIAEAHGRTSWILEVRETNTAARALYERCGFLKVGERRGYYRDTGESALLMRGIPSKSWLERQSF